MTRMFQELAMIPLRFSISSTGIFFWSTFTIRFLYMIQWLPYERDWSIIEVQGAHYYPILLRLSYTWKSRISPILFKKVLWGINFASCCSGWLESIAKIFVSSLHFSFFITKQSLQLFLKSLQLVSAKYIGNEIPYLESSLNSYKSRILAQAIRVYIGFFVYLATM